MAVEDASRNVVEAEVEPTSSWARIVKVPAAGLVAAHSPKTAFENVRICSKVMGFVIESPICWQARSLFLPQLAPVPESPQIERMLAGDWPEGEVANFIGEAGSKDVSGSQGLDMTTEKFWAACMSKVWETSEKLGLVTVRVKVFNETPRGLV